jgi:5S rRNA maturation endonuclease (ribonuclease M5)
MTPPAERAVLERILDKLGASVAKVRWHQHGVTTLCPAHDDRNTPNLDIDIKGDMVLYTCRAGCAQDAVTAAMRAHGITHEDLSLNGHMDAAPPEEVTKHYRYENASGVLVAEKVITRYLPKGIRKKKVAWRRCDPDRPGEWTYNLNGISPGLYRHPELVGEAEQCASAERPFVIYHVEGEDCADDIRQLGLAATTWPNGAAGWKSEYADAIAALKPDSVIVLPDADEPGEAVAVRAAADLHQRKVSVRLLHLPELRPNSGDDVSDWLAAGHTRAELLEHTDRAPRFDPQTTTVDQHATGDSPQTLGEGLGTFLRRPFPPLEPYIEGLLSGDGGGWLAGEEKLGKTYYALEEALCLALGLKVCDRFVVPERRRVMLIEEEDSPRRTQARLRALLRGHDLDPDSSALQAELDAWFRLEVWEGFTFDDEQMIKRLEATITAFQPAVVYIDVLRKVTTADLNKASEASKLLAVLDDLRRSYNVIPRVLAHYRKGQGLARAGRGSQELGGSYVLGAWAENSLFFEPIGRKQGAVRVEAQTKDGAPIPPFRLVFESEGPRHAPTLVRLKAEDDRSGEDVDDAVVHAVATLPKTEAIKGSPGVSVQAIALALTKSDKTIRRSLKSLKDVERVVVTGKAAKGKELYGVPEPTSVSASQ